MELNKSFVIKKKQTVELSDGLKITFDGHSHKTVMQGGPSSPLIVYMTFTLESTKESKSFNVFEENGKLEFSWQAYQFGIKSHDYDQSMTLVVTKVP